jgi:hypothetical protein
MTKAFIEEQKFEHSLFHPYIEGPNIGRWKVNWNPSNDRFVLYPYERHQGHIRPTDLRRYPRVKAYLELHKRRLEGRPYVRNAGRSWYELWVRQDPSYFDRPLKIVTPDFANRNTFALDDRQFYVGGSALAINLKDQDGEFAYYVLGLLNSELYEFFHKVGTSTFIYAGRYRYWVSYLAQYPILDYRGVGQGALFSPEQYDRRDLCLRISKLAFKLSQDGQDPEWEDELNNDVYEVFGLDERARNVIAETLGKVSPRRVHEGFSTVP